MALKQQLESFTVPATGRGGAGGGGAGKGKGQGGGKSNTVLKYLYFLLKIDFISY